MEEMLKFIFTNLTHTETTIKNIERAICQQDILNRKMNNRVILYTLSVCAFTAIVSNKYKHQEKKIACLKKEIEELKERWRTPDEAAE